MRSEDTFGGINIPKIIGIPLKERMNIFLKELVVARYRNGTKTFQQKVESLNRKCKIRCH